MWKLDFKKLKIGKIYKGRFGIFPQKKGNPESVRPCTSVEENCVGAGDDAGQEGGDEEGEGDDGGETLDHQESQSTGENQPGTDPPAPSSHTDPARAVAAQTVGQPEHDLEETELGLTELSSLPGLADSDK